MTQYSLGKNIVEDAIQSDSTIAVLTEAIADGVETGLENTVISSGLSYGYVTSNSVAVPLSTNSSVLAVGAFLTALAANSNTIVYVGDENVETSGGYALEAGKSLEIPAGIGLNGVYVVSSDSAVVSYFGG